MVDPAVKAAKEADEAPEEAVAAQEQQQQQQKKKPPEDPRAQKVRVLIEKPVSRPEESTTTAGIELYFNCNRCQFDVLGDVSTLPLDSMFNLNAPKSRTAIGLVRMAAGRDVPFQTRAEFPNKWLSAAEHGLVHDGYQGDGVLDLRLEWRTEGKKGKKVSVTVQCLPWLAYRTSKGARVSIRSLGAAKGYSGTIDRMISNYPSPGASRWVVRLDNKVKDVDKNEEIVDVTPENVVLSKPIMYEKDTRIHFLNKASNSITDAKVVEWLGEAEGSKHMILIEKEKPPEEAAAAPEEEAPGKKSQGKKPKSAVSQEEAQPIVVDLNECNHSEQRFDTAAQYEEARKIFCQELRDENEFVEDAITGQKLRIEDQFVLMQVVEASGEKAPDRWKKMASVRDMVKLMVEPSPDRVYGTHLAQPCLVVAGPGAGKTWMLKQLSYLVSSELYNSKEPGIRLVPIVVFVQRIVRYLRDT